MDLLFYILRSQFKGSEIANKRLREREVDINAILSGPDYFTCQRLHTTMLKIRCVERQKAITVNKGGRYPATTERRTYDEECHGCEQGKEIMSAIGEGEQEVKEKKFRKRGGKTEEIMEKVINPTAGNVVLPVVAPLCTKCKERPAVMRKDGSRVINGLCGPCRANRGQEKRALRPKKDKVPTAKVTYRRHASIDTQRLSLAIRLWDRLMMEQGNSGIQKGDIIAALYEELGS